MSYQPPPQVSFGEEITAIVVNQLRYGLTQYETFFNFTSPPPDIRMIHAASKFVMWSFYTANNTSTFQFNAASFWSVGVAASVAMACLSTTAASAYVQLMRPSSGINTASTGFVALRIDANGDVTAQMNTNYNWIKVLFMLTVMN